MYKEVLRSIDGIGIYPVISFVIFLSFFLMLSIYLLTMRKDLIHQMENLPLDEHTESNSESNQTQPHEKEDFR